MNLKSLIMEKFGIFRERKLEFGPGLNLIFGPNESGKTTLVDAIVLGLLSHSDKKGSKLKGFPRALKTVKDRYGSEISLHLVVEHEAQDLTFPAPQNFQDRWGVGWDELRAIFICREGDLELAKGEPREFRNWWGALKGKLLGFQEEPKQVLKKIAAEAGLTENLGLKSEQQRRRTAIQEKLSWYHDNENRIRSLRGLEKDLEELKLKEEELARDMEKAKKGLRKAKLLRAKEIYQQMNSAQQKLRAEYGRYAEKDVREWEKWQGDLEKEEALLKRLRQQKDQEEQRHRKANAKAAQLGQQVIGLAEKLSLVAEKEPELAEAAHLEGKDHEGGIPRWAPWISWAGAVLALILGLYAKSSGLLVGAVMLVALAIGLSIFLGSRARTRSQLRHQRERFLRWGRDLGLEVVSLVDLRLQLMDLRSKKDGMEGQRQQLQDQLPKLAQAVENLAKEEKTKTEAVEEIRGQIRHLRDRVGLSDLEELRQRVQRKKELESDVEKKYKAQLRVLLDSDEPSWPGELEELKSLAKIQPVEDETQVDRLNRALEDCRRKQGAKYQELTDLKAELKGNFGAQRPEEVIWKAQDMQRELREMEILQRAGQKVRKVFERLLKRTDALLDEIIGGEAVCGGFQKITGGKYRAVTMENLTLRAMDAQGKEWGFSSLSTGTRDQLLTVLRLALAERRLQGKGFLIFDDALVTSDRARLREQMEMLGRLTQEGWQILFLTAQDEVRQEAERLTELGVDVRLLDL